MRISKYILVLSILLIIIYFFFPLKFAKKNFVETNFEKGIFICEPAAVTGANWVVRVSPDKVELIILRGNAPDLKLKNFLFTSYKNKYIIKGKLLKEKDEMVKGSGILLDAIFVEEWEIIRPIKRDHFLEAILPNRWLTPFDYRLI